MVGDDFVVLAERLPLAEARRLAVRIQDPAAAAIVVDPGGSPL